jgi:LPXTG-motif cell wall-anchored protein
VPVQVPGLSRVIAIAAGAYHSLAVKSDGTVWAWGGNGAGQLGDGSTTDHQRPVPVRALRGPLRMSSGAGAPTTMPTTGGSSDDVAVLLALALLLLLGGLGVSWQGRRQLPSR